MMEKAWQEYARLGLDTSFHLVRYGNVLESTGSVIEVWKNQIAKREPIRVTDPLMTRFFISPSQAVDLVLNGLKLESGMILIPKMKSLSIGMLAQYTVNPEFGTELIPMRPGEKMHEELLTLEEGDFVTESDEYFFLRPTTSQRNVVNETEIYRPFKYSSDIAPELTKEELEVLLADE